MMSFNHFSDIAKSFTPLLHTAVTNTAKGIVSDFSANCAYDTGFMSESGYIVTSDESTYGEGMEPIRKGAYLLPEVEAPDNETTAIAAIGANYTVFVELGTRFQSAQPAFYPAVDRASTTFESELNNVVDELEARFG
jgi:hypothetical protein